MTLLVLGLAGSAAATVARNPDEVVVSQASSGELVRQVQSALHDRWGMTIVVDGRYGSQTTGAVEEFQSGQSLEPTGTVDRRTFDRLLGKRELLLSTATRRTVRGLAAAFVMLAGLLALIWTSTRRAASHKVKRAPEVQLPEKHLVIFISYRRADTPAHQIVPRLFDSLREVLRGDNVFLDDRSIAWGDPIDDALRAHLRDTDVLLAIIGSNWQAERLREPHDWVREELQTVRQRGNRVIPVLVGDDAPPIATLREMLPDDLRWLADRKAFHIGAYPDDDIQRLTVYFQHEITHSLQPLTPEGVLGVARQADLIAEPNRLFPWQQDLILSLRLERRQAGPLPVELRGGDVLEGGTIEDGDIVEVPQHGGERSPSMTRVPFMLNRTTGTTVRITKSRTRKLFNASQVAIPVLFMALVIAAAIVALIVT